MSNHIRVSEILAQFRDFSRIHHTVLNTKADIGTETHHNINLYCNGGMPIFESFPNYSRALPTITQDERGNDIITWEQEPEILSWEDRGEGYFRSYQQYHNQRSPRYNLMEQRFYDDNLMITGQIDALLVTDSLPMLIDYKCSYNVDEEIWGMQAHYYKHLLEVNGIEIADTCIFMQLKKDAKKPKLVEIKFNDEMMSRCINEAILFWERKQDGK